MTRHLREDIDLPQDRGCLRWVLGVPLVLLYLPAAYLCYIALAMTPDGPPSPYDPERDTIRLTAGMSIGLCLVGLLLTAVPVFHRTMGRWWYAGPFLLAAIAYVRAQTA
ncbi:hypothetical protein OOK31_35220 [Streptomyces sp. NBC_00249]|uniref:hypothetical protein n=1 Tax=Streptomyces sp. NBC_00249 TaxID=2975690 RepID=UPI002254ECA5|nr:hypothetical protein [Streptomyces sp. NBC_00249]MCX5199078.1 hypothetical protein [Streptomyces sp. NBC_00249]